MSVQWASKADPKILTSKVVVKSVTFSVQNLPPFLELVGDEVWKTTQRAASQWDPDMDANEGGLLLSESIAFPAPLFEITLNP